MKENWNKNDLLKLCKYINGLVFLYYPIDIDDLINIIEGIDKKLYEKFYYNEMLGIINTLVETEELFKFDNQLSIVSKKDIKELFKVDEIDYVKKHSGFKKHFSKKEVLEYSIPFEYNHNSDYKKLKEYVYSLDLNDNNEEIFYDLIGVCSIMADDDAFVSKLGKEYKFNTDKLKELVSNFMRSLPRGFLNGFSFGELDVVYEEIDDGNFHKIYKPYHPLKFEHYSYNDCVDLANQLKNTKLFEYVNSDLLLEFYIKDKPIFIQLLGFYNGDRNIVIYGDIDGMARNYCLMNSSEKEYPDITNRIDIMEVILDDASGFFIDNIRKDIDDNHYPSLPLFVKMTPGKEYPISLVNEKDIDLVGAILESLLKWEDMAGDDIKEQFSESDFENIYQVYLNENGLEYGYYLNLDDEIPGFSFEIDLDSIGKVDVSNLNKRNIGIGIFIPPFSVEDKKTYLTILYDYDHDLILDSFPSLEEDMPNILNTITTKLTKHKINPNNIYYNNNYTYYVLFPLKFAYEEVNFIHDDENRINDIYLDMIGALEEFNKDKKTTYH